MDTVVLDCRPASAQRVIGSPAARAVSRAVVVALTALACLPAAAAAQDSGWHGTMSGRLQVEETDSAAPPFGTPWTSTFSWTAEGSAILTEPVPGGVHGSGTGSSNAIHSVTYDGPTNCFDILGGTFVGSGPLEFDPVVVSVRFLDGHWRIDADPKSVRSIHTVFGACGNTSTETNDVVWGTIGLDIPGSAGDQEIHGTFDALNWAGVSAGETISGNRHTVNTAQVSIHLSRKLDTDGDGIDDISELENGSDPYDPSDPAPAGCAGTAEPGVLWPPDHTFRRVSISGPNGEPLDASIVTVTQDEPLNGLGDGDTSPDARPGQDRSAVDLRSERSGLSDGRVYRISYWAFNPNGGVCTGTVSVGVPHDMGQGDAPIDSAPPSHNSFAP